MGIIIGRDYKGKFLLGITGAPAWFKFGEPARIGTRYFRRLI